MGRPLGETFGTQVKRMDAHSEKRRWAGGIFSSVSHFSSIKESWTNWSLRPLLCLFYRPLEVVISETWLPNAGHQTRLFSILALHWYCWVGKAWRSGMACLSAIPALPLIALLSILSAVRVLTYSFGLNPWIYCLLLAHLKSATSLGFLFDERTQSHYVLLVLFLTPGHL